MKQDPQVSNDENVVVSVAASVGSLLILVISVIMVLLLRRILVRDNRNKTEKSTVVKSQRLQTSTTNGVGDHTYNEVYDNMEMQ